jgi:molecular chaperone DnaK (HSP70)
MGRWNRGGLPHSVGIETKHGTFTPLIPKGTPLPVSVTETFTTADPNQPSIQIKPYQGENSIAPRNKRLGLFEVTEIPPAGPGEPLIEVTFHIDARGAFSITARDGGTGRDLPVLQRLRPRAASTTGAHKLTGASTACRDPAEVPMAEQSWRAA